MTKELIEKLEALGRSVDIAQRAYTEIPDVMSIQDRAAAFEALGRCAYVNLPALLRSLQKEQKND